jgi:hypothetical protein
MRREKGKLTPHHTVEQCRRRASGKDHKPCSAISHGKQWDDGWAVCQNCGLDLANYFLRPRS